MPANTVRLFSVDGLLLSAELFKSSNIKPRHILEGGYNNCNAILDGCSGSFQVLIYNYKTKLAVQLNGKLISEDEKVEILNKVKVSDITFAKVMSRKRHSYGLLIVETNNPIP